MPITFLGFLLVGVFVGALSGMFGIGGILAFLQFYRAGHVHVAAALLLIAGFLAGSYFSASWTVTLPDLLLKRAFGGLLVVMGMIYILTAR